MIIFAPVLLLIGCMLLILVWSRIKPGIGYSLMLAVAASLASVGLMIFLRFRLPTELIVSNWLPVNAEEASLDFILDYSSWPFAFCLMIFGLAVLLTSSARIQGQTNPWLIAGSVGVLGISLMAIEAANPLSLVLAWTAFDFIEITVELAVVEDRSLNRQTAFAFAIRVLGTLLVIMAMLYTRINGSVLSLTSIPPQAGLLVLMAVAMRLGVFPLHLPFSEESRLRRGLGDVLRVAGPFSSLVVLGRLPETAVPAEFRVPLLFVIAWAALYGSAQWVFAQDELEGRPYWMIGMGSLAISCVINGKPVSSQAWSLALMLVGSTIFLYSARSRGTMFIPALAVLALSGLPLSPTASGWAGLLSDSPGFIQLLYIIVHALLVIGVVRHAFQPAENLTQMERWIQVAYPAGLLGLVICQWVIGIWGWRGAFSTGVWWASLASLLIVAASLWVGSGRAPFIKPDTVVVKWLGVVFRRIGAVLKVIFSLGWLYELFNRIYRGLQMIVDSVTRILEGEGGMLWTLIILAIVASLIQVELR